MLATISTSAAGIVPAVRNDIYLQNVTPFTAACFAGPGTELSLAPMQEPADVKTNPALAGTLCKAFHTLGADRLYAPTPTDANGEIIEPTALSRVLLLGKGILLFRNPMMPADGTFLRSPGDAGIFSASGCGVIVATLEDRFVFAHAGRDSLIDRGRVLGNRPRHHESVVDSIIGAFLELGCTQDQLKDMHAWMFYSIMPEDFLHRYDNKDHAVYNRKVGPDVLARLRCGVQKTAEGVELDLPIIAKAQFVQHGVPEEHIHLKHGYLHKELPHTRRGGGRYLVAIVRR